MDTIKDRIISPDVTIGAGVSIGPHSTIQADKVVLDKDVQLGDYVHIACDTLELGAGSKIGDHSEILCPQVLFSEGCSVGDGSSIQLNDYLILGKYSVIGRRFTLSGQGFKCGEFLWLKNDVIVGGGGSSGPRSYLTIGSGTTIIDKCYINLSEEVEIGSNTALSYNVNILTHGAWQPLLMGYPTQFAPVHLGNYVVIYLNAVILPGVTIGDFTAVSANSVVTKDVPSHCLAAGIPAKIKKGPVGYPPTLNKVEIDSLLINILMDYLTTLPSKNILILEDKILTDGYAVIEYENTLQTISYIPIDRHLPVERRADITLAYGSGLYGLDGHCHFDLFKETISGELTAIGEDLRDYLRRRAIRIMTGRPFRTIPLSNLNRLRMKKRTKRL
ncbi:MAG: hypothetical protein AB2L12_10420 [Smithellaceae bacterium]